jgi:hypothetical protein
MLVNVRSAAPLVYHIDVDEKPLYLNLRCCIELVSARRASNTALVECVRVRVCVCVLALVLSACVRKEGSNRSSSRRSITAASLDLLVASFLIHLIEVVHDDSVFGVSDLSVDALAWSCLHACVIMLV